VSLAAELLEDIAAFHDDPLGFVLYAFPWAVEGRALSDVTGPRQWQREGLELIGQRLQEGATLEAALAEAIQLAVASGHGIGKSAFVAMVILWAISTREDTRGVVTANTEGQLRTKTWPELAKWHQMCICGHWFEFTASSLYSRQPGHERTWRIDAVAWSDTNTEAFAGLHNKGRRILLVFDEASAISDKIWEVSEGAMTDEGTEIVWLAFGNPTRNSGRFFDCFNRMRHRWAHKQIDSRTVEGTNKTQIAKWVEDYGEDHDFVRVRVRGVFPRAGTMQFIARDLVDEAMGRPLEHYRPHSRVALVGVDVARFGDDQSVIRTRLQRDARTWPPLRFRGLDTMQLAARVGEHINELKRLGLRVIVFVDGGGVGGGVIDRLRQLEHEVIEVNFGGRPDDPRKYKNKSAEMWDRVRIWLPSGYLDRDETLATDLTGREYGFDSESRIVMESKDDMKARGLASPDDADALALTFAHPAMEVLDPEPEAAGRRESSRAKAHNPFDRTRLRR
jgi:hypothetical protein